jgi:hypothetical protein
VPYSWQSGGPITLAADNSQRRCARKKYGPQTAVQPLHLSRPCMAVVGVGVNECGR